MTDDAETVAAQTLDTARLAAWMDDSGLPGAREPLEIALLSGGTQNEIYEIRRGEHRSVLRIPPKTAPADRDRASCANGGSSRR